MIVVQWEMEVPVEDDPLQAAQQAHDTRVWPAPEQLVYIVRDTDTGQAWQVDLYDQSVAQVLY